MNLVKVRLRIDPGDEYTDPAWRTYWVWGCDDCATDKPCRAHGPRT